MKEISRLLRRNGVRLRGLPKACMDEWFRPDESPMLPFATKHIRIWNALPCEGGCGGHANILAALEAAAKREDLWRTAGASLIDAVFMGRRKPLRQFLRATLHARTSGV